MKINFDWMMTSQYSWKNRQSQIGSPMIQLCKTTNHGNNQPHLSTYMSKHPQMDGGQWQWRWIGNISRNRSIEYGMDIIAMYLSTYIYIFIFIYLFIYVVFLFFFFVFCLLDCLHLFMYLFDYIYGYVIKSPSNCRTKMMTDPNIVACWRDVRLRQRIGQMDS